MGWILLTTRKTTIQFSNSGAYYSRANQVELCIQMKKENGEESQFVQSTVPTSFFYTIRTRILISCEWAQFPFCYWSGRPKSYIGFSSAKQNSSFPSLGGIPDTNHICKQQRFKQIMRGLYLIKLNNTQIVIKERANCHRQRGDKQHVPTKCRGRLAGAGRFDNSVREYDHFGKSPSFRPSLSTAQQSWNPSVFVKHSTRVFATSVSTTHNTAGPHATHVKLQNRSRVETRRQHAKAIEMVVHDQSSPAARDNMNISHSLPFLGLHKIRQI